MRSLQPPFWFLLEGKKKSYVTCRLFCLTHFDQYSLLLIACLIALHAEHLVGA